MQACHVLRLLVVASLASGCPGERSLGPDGAGASDSQTAERSLPPADGPKREIPTGPSEGGPRDLACVPGETTLPPIVASADATVDEGSPGTSAGSAATLYVDQGPAQHVYLRFTVGALPGPVKTAKLRFQVLNASTSGPSVHATSSAWQEASITWSNRPLPGVKLADVGAAAVGPRELAFPTSAIAGPGEHSFVLVPTSSDGMDLSSREGATPSALVLTVQTCTSAPSDGKPLSLDGKPPVGPAFRFVSWADTKTAVTELSTLSDQVAALKPAFTIYEGDLVDSWSTTAIEAWRKAVGGELTGTAAPNGIFELTFPVRGNHDNSATGWETWMAANHPMGAAAAAIGAKSFSSMAGKENQVYSFDYGNAHLVGLDAAGDVTMLSAAQVIWLDQDLSAAEARGIQHSFVYFHGPIYCVDGHCSCTTGICSSATVVNDLLTALAKHPSLSATFHGHEHLYAYVYLDSTRDARLTKPFHQFVTGDAGAGPSACDKPGRFDYCMASAGFTTIDVAGPSVTVSFYKTGVAAPQKVVSYTKP